MEKSLKTTPVQELSSAEGTTSYFRIIWSGVLTALLLCGCLWCLNGTWAGYAPSIWKQAVAAAAGVIGCGFAKRGKKKYGFAWIGYLLPAVSLVVLAPLSRVLSGARAWADMVIAQWNALQEGTTVVFSYSAEESSLLAFALVTAVCVSILTTILVLDRHPAVVGALCVVCLIIQLMTDNVNPTGCVMMITGILGLSISGTNLNVSRLAFLWVIGVGAVTCLCMMCISADNLNGVIETRQQVGRFINEVRYGQTVLPEGDLNKASCLMQDSEKMMTVSSQQVKDLYLRGYIGGVYRKGKWEKTPESTYDGQNAGMLKWLKKYNFDPVTQVARYYELSGTDEKPERNTLRVEVSGASSAYLYAPESAADVRDISVKSVKDMRLMSKGFFGRKHYTIDEYSTSKPAELAVADSWVYAPETKAQQEYKTAEEVYRSFVYDNYVAVDRKLYGVIQKMFWDDYETDSDGIFSAVEHIRSKLKSYFRYSNRAGDLGEVPEGEDPLLWFLTESRTGNSVLYASAAVECLRVHGIPARYVEGYYISSSELAQSEDGSISVNGRHAHAWVEAYFDGIGWMPLDVTPGYYYDTVNLQKLVAAPDMVRKNAALKDNSYEGEEIAGMDEANKKSEEKESSEGLAAGTVAAAVGAILIIICTVFLAAFEMRRTIRLQRKRRIYQSADPQQKVVLAEREICHALELWGIASSLGWETELTDSKVSQKIENISKGEYSRVCQILEKAIYGGQQPEKYEFRTLLAFIHKIIMPKRSYGIRQYLKLRYKM